MLDIVHCLLNIHFPLVLINYMQILRKQQFCVPK